MLITYVVCSFSKTIIFTTYTDVIIIVKNVDKFRREKCDVIDIIYHNSIIVSPMLYY